MSRIHHSSRRLLVTAVAAMALSVFAAPAVAQLTNVDAADDVCPPTANPCIVTQSVKIVDGAVLDFGLRAVEVRLSGVLDCGAGTATVRCGNFEAATGTAVAIKAAGPSGEDTIEGGSFTLEALRACSADTNVRCTEPGDCDLGTCEADHCSRSAERTCFGDEDCNLGLCTVGSGDVDVNGVIDASGRSAGELTVHAGGDIILRQAFLGSATGAAFDGSSVDLASGHGSVTVLAPIEARGGAAAQGGFISIAAAGNVESSSTIDAIGGDFDGGFVAILAGGDVLIDGNVLANAAIGEGSGGDISITAAGDLTVGAGRTIEANGNKARQGPFSGDGGSVELVAGHDLFASTGSSFSADGEEPNGSGNIIALTAGRDLSLDGTFSARSRGSDGEGGDVMLSAEGVLTATPATVIDVRGGTAGGGSAALGAGSLLDFSGNVMAVATGGVGDSVVFQSAGQATIHGDVSMGGTTPSEGLDGSIEVSACGVDVAGGASLVNACPLGKNTLTASGDIVVHPGAAIRAQGINGKNEFVIGPESPTPLVQGTVAPAAQIIVENDLAACAECGNGQVDQGETCDDANGTSGDGCTDCQDDRCIAQTLNWPVAPLCNDEAACTTDTCNTDVGDCEHVIACDDGFACTTDSCNPLGDCVHDTDDSLCNDGKFCTKDVCLESSGCVGFDEDKACDDGLDCTSDDACALGRCRGMKNCAEGSFCSNVTGGCVAGETTTTTTNTTTTNSTTTTTIVVPVCGDGTVDATEECDDGDVAWTFGEPCNAQCQLLGCGDPDDDTAVHTTDSLIALRTAVGAEHCATCICDVDGSAQVTATDALALLRKAVGLPVTLGCPACSL